MQFDLRRNALANLHLIQKHLAKLSVPDIPKNSKELLTAIQTSLDLLHNDIILLFNHNFYLQCKLNDKDKTLTQLQKRYTHLQENAKLSQQITKRKYEKHLHNLQYFQFALPNQQHHKVLEKALAQPLPDCFTSQLPTPKKTLTLKDTHWGLDHKDTLSKPKTLKQAFECPQHENNYDLEIHLEGVMSEQMANKCPQDLKVTAKSAAEGERGKRRKRGGSEQPKHERTVEKQVKEGKRSQLAKLVAQQFKIPAVKEKYFTTDIF